MKDKYLVKIWTKTDDPDVDLITENGFITEHFASRFYNKQFDKLDGTEFAIMLKRIGSSTVSRLIVNGTFTISE